ncbi:peptidoglycan-binding domain-containing protein [Micromonospora sp. LOL_024]|uniref:peptidoglycan-binding domain-containing protein n=1 Tax=Micromonospora sp. LOL_024 TaxID=3345412 RepID=UPI003A842642
MLSRIGALLTAVALVFSAMVVTAAPASAATAPCRQYHYGYGGTGNCVKAIQGIANVISITNAGRSEAGPVARDGIYGAKTEAAIRKIQRAAGVGVDGWVGPQTWVVLCHYGAFWGKNMKAKADYRWAKSYAC